jgi:hypothetical protein
MTSLKHQSFDLSVLVDLFPHLTHLFFTGSQNGNIILKEIKSLANLPGFISLSICEIFTYLENATLQ